MHSQSLPFPIPERSKKTHASKDDPLVSMMTLQVKAMAEASRHNKTMEELKQKEVAAALTENEHTKNCRHERKRDGSGT